VLSFDAAAGSGWTFAGWTYSVTGRTNPATLTATSETLVFANFNTTTAPLVLTNLSPGNTVAGSADFTLTIKGKGFDTGSLVTFNGNYPAVTYVSSTE
jgi:alpha-D-ribose 1-methylphosphonate 5-triphosphate synthase subunit PhnH